MIRKLLVGILLFSPMTAFSSESDQVNGLNSLNSAIQDVDLEDFIIVPFQGTWVQGANTFVFAAGDTRRDDGFIEGNIIGGAGVINRYLWKQTTSLTGIFYFDTEQGRQGPLYVSLSNSNRRMTWKFGSESTVLNKVN